MTGDGAKYLIFTLQGKRFALDLAHVAEVEEVPVMWPIPSAPSCYTGAVNFHGTIVAVMDLALFLGFTDCTAPGKMITLDVRIASLAFLVEQVVRITPVGDAILAEAPDDAYATATLKLADGDATLLDAHQIVTMAQETING
jgi:purine-binding chemotaxis protein CheW